MVLPRHRRCLPRRPSARTQWTHLQGVTQPPVIAWRKDRAIRITTPLAFPPVARRRPALVAAAAIVPHSCRLRLKRLCASSCLPSLRTDRIRGARATARPTGSSRASRRVRRFSRATHARSRSALAAAHSTNCSNAGRPHLRRRGHSHAPAVAEPLAQRSEPVRPSLPGTCPRDPRRCLREPPQARRPRAPASSRAPVHRAP
jgi:hypothetical protein